MKTILIKNLINLWCLEYGRYGLTIPFLIGSEKQFGENPKYNFDDLFEELYSADTKYLITYCNDLGEFVIGLPKSESTPLNMLNHYGFLYIGDCELEKYNSFEKLKEYLKGEYFQFIDKDQFSKNMDTGKWGSYDKEDLLEIKRAKEMLI